MLLTSFFLDSSSSELITVVVIFCHSCRRRCYWSSLCFTAAYILMKEFVAFSISFLCINGEGERDRIEKIWK